MCKTRRGIYHNLNKTEYAISNGEIAFFFSSEFYLDKFLREYHGQRELFKERLERAMILDDMEVGLLSDIHLYKEIEKRGFRVNVKGVEMNWQNLLEYVLWNVTLMKQKDWYRMLELSNVE